MKVVLKNGASATVDENCPKEVIEALSEAVKKTKELQEYPCPQCQGGGCPFCCGYGTVFA